MELDVLIFGGGISGLWLVDELHRLGFCARLIEADALGAGQTICSQGIIHGGIKYSLNGLRSSSGSAIREMPDTWRGCLEGRSAPDLREVCILSPSCYLWRTTTLRSRAGLIGAKVALRTPVHTVATDERPASLVGCPGEVLRVDEPVLDVGSLLTVLAQRNPGRLLAGAEPKFRIDVRGGVQAVTVRSASSATHVEFEPANVVLAAGAGNERLRQQIGLPPNAMQRRPLHMVLVRGDLPNFHGHCIDGSRTRVTITSAPFAGGQVWQVGGQISEDGVAAESHDLMARARAELNAVLPSVDFRGAQWATYRVDRAEAKTRDGRRPDDCTVLRERNVLTAWPTKLAMAPRLTSLILQQLDRKPTAATKGPRDLETLDWPRPKVARPPWERVQHWHSFD